MQVTQDKAFRVLLVEDVAYEAELVVNQLERAGLRFDWHRVETEEALRTFRQNCASCEFFSEPPASIESLRGSAKHVAI